jgi:hypothetical protein
MNLSQRFGIRMTTRYLVFGLVIWWLAMFLGYAIISLRTDRIREKISKSGIEMAQELSDLVSLPLLEKKDQTVHRLLVDKAKDEAVVYASVVDHRDKVVAFIATDQLVPRMAETKPYTEQVSIWEGGFTSPAKMLNFASDVIYAGTKIGKIFIGLSTSETTSPKIQYLFIALTSFLVLLIFFIFFRYPSVKTFLLTILDYRRSKIVTQSIDKGPLIYCPMCGTQKRLDEELFNPSIIDRFMTTGVSKHRSNPADANMIDLNELAKNQDLSWIRRRLILRCTDIITKLAT